MNKQNGAFMCNLSANFNNYYAAANTFSGFISDFDKIFESRKYEVIYILKGGPGTGKSTIMKYVSGYFQSNGYATENIYCSSDTKSLDGVIVKRNQRSAAIIDGTAPHLFDPKYPGAVEIIINLLQDIDAERYSDKREEIIKLSEAKSKAYKDAYSYLKLAGVIHDKITALFEQNEVYNTAEKIISDCNLIELHSNSHAGKAVIRRLSAFGKDGYVKPMVGDNHIIKSILGDGLSEHIILNAIKEKYISKSMNILYSPLPMTDKAVDLVATCNAVFVADNSNCNGIDSTLLTASLPGEYIVLKNMYFDTLRYAEKSFKLASDRHFDLEKIYGSRMSFTRHDDYKKHIIDRIEHALK